MLAVDPRQGLDHLLYWFLSDDAFYTFEISRHIPEFNWGIATSGFHPLYVLLIAPFHRALSPELAVPASLLVLVTSLAVATIVLYRLLEPLWGRGVAYFCVAVWSVNGGLYSVALTGLEATLAATFVLVFFALWSRIDASSAGPPSTRAHLALGITAGLAFWARMDSSLIVAPAGVLLGLRLLRRRNLRCLAALALPAVVIPLIWLTIIGLQSGNAFPDSSAALRNLRGLEGSWLAPAGSIQRSMMRLGWGIEAFFWSGARALRPWMLLGPLVLAAAGCLAWGCRAAGGLGRSRARLAGWLSAGFVLWGGYYVLHLGGFRPWYFAQAGPFVFVALLPPVVSCLGRTLPTGRARWAVGALGAAAIGWWTLPVEPRAPQEYDKYHAAQVAGRFLDAQAATGGIAAFNTGVYDYVMKRDVLNLDGVVNPQALAANRANDLPAYLASKNVRFLIEHHPDEAATAHRLFNDPRVRLEKWVDLSEQYPPFGEQHAKRTYLWKLENR